MVAALRMRPVQHDQEKGGHFLLRALWVYLSASTGSQPGELRVEAEPLRQCSRPTLSWR